MTVSPPYRRPDTEANHDVNPAPTTHPRTLEGGGKTVVRGWVKLSRARRVVHRLPFHWVLRDCGPDTVRALITRQPSPPQRQQRGAGAGVTPGSVPQAHASLSCLPSARKARTAWASQRATAPLLALQTCCGQLVPGMAGAVAGVAISALRRRGPPSAPECSAADLAYRDARPPPHLRRPSRPAMLPACLPCGCAGRQGWPARLPWSACPFQPPSLVRCNKTYGCVWSSSMPSHPRASTAGSGLVVAFGFSEYVCAHVFRLCRSHPLRNARLLTSASLMISAARLRLGARIE